MVCRVEKHEEETRTRVEDTQKGSKLASAWHIALFAIHLAYIYPVP